LSRLRMAGLLPRQPGLPVHLSRTGEV